MWGSSFRILPGLRLRVNAKGVGLTVGPREAKVYLGAGRPRVGGRVGPFWYMNPLRRRR